ncbi:MAG: prepilin-type N-terminal cleavage/methylation domain-containing protein [Gemmatimonadota bacterium]
MRPRAKPKGSLSRGFTLVELVVAATVAGIALTGGAAALRVAADSRARTSHRLDSIEQEAIRRRVLVDLLTGALRGTPAVPHTFHGTDARKGALPDDQIRFDVAAAEPYTSVETAVRLFIDRNDSTPETGLVAELATRPEVEPLRISIAPSAISLDVEYLPPDPRAGVWLRGWISTVQLPGAARLTIEAKESDETPLLGLPVLVALGPAT